MTKPKALYILGTGNRELIYSDEDQARIAELVDETGPTQTAQSILECPELMADLEIILSGWGGPRIDADFLEKAPNLKAVFYGAGSIRNIVSDAFWEKDITICSAWSANGIPVAEYTVSQILFCLKLGYQFIRRTDSGKWGKRDLEVFGGYKSTVGLISLGMIGRYVCEYLKAFDLDVIAYDPFIPRDAEEWLEVELVETLDEVFERAAVVSLHTPNLPSTKKMIQGRHFELMQKNASFINTARGAVIDEPAMVEVLQKRPDITAVLDVTFPEPPAKESPLWTLQNVILTPHIAGSMNKECQRMGNFMRRELEKYLSNEQLEWSVDRELFERMA